ncbi:UNVERIFIED_CONTAM: Serine/threonine-protein kinase 3 [Gekko kuhli]
MFVLYIVQNDVVEFRIVLYHLRLQAIFMIPTNPPPTFRKPELWSDEFTDFVKKCLVKNPEQRATATQLLQHPFIKNAKPVSILRDLITEAMEIKAKRHEEQQRELEEEDENSDEDELDSHTMVKSSSESAGTMRATSTMSESAQTMIEHNSTMLESDLGTMVINSDDDDDDDDEDGTMKKVELAIQVMVLFIVNSRPEIFIFVWKMINSSVDE